MIEYENLGKSNASFFDEYQKAFSTVLREGSFILANQVSAFESNYAQYCGVKYCCGVASGFDALVLSLMAFEFKPGSEVIVPSNTYVATIFSIVRAGLVPVLVEPRLDTYNLDPDRISLAITSKTVAVVAVHLYGKCCEINRILEVCREHNLRLIEDAAQAHGAAVNDQKAGSFGSIAAFSFYPTKNLGSLGDGGCVTTDDESLYRRIKSLRNYGSIVKYENEIIGFNSRLDEVQAAFLQVKLKKLDEINHHKMRLAALYLKNLKGDFTRPVVQQYHSDVYHIFNVRHPERDRLREYLFNKGIGTEIHYPIPPHRQKAMKGILGNVRYPIAEQIHETTISLPISYFHAEEDILKVIEVMNAF